jgi:hypothetical protein
MLVAQINALFDRIKREHYLTSDDALRRYLEAATGIKLSEMTIYRWRRGEYPKGLEVLGPQLVLYADAIRDAIPAEPTEPQAAA